LPGGSRGLGDVYKRQVNRSFLPASGFKIDKKASK
jgi:hypothetical protein